MSGAVAALIQQQQTLGARPPAPVVPPTPAPITITWIGSPNYTPGRPTPPKAIIIHTMGGSLAGTDSWFRNPAAQASTHYGVGLSGRISQYVHLDDTAWGNGVLEPGNRWPWPGNPNGITVSIETEDLGNPNQPVTDTLFASVLAVCRFVTSECPTIELLSTHAIISPASRPNCAGKRWVESGRLLELASVLGLPLLAPGIDGNVPQPAVVGRDEVIRIIRQVAGEAGIPAVLLLALAYAESRFDPLARRPVDPADDPAFWGDVSMGAFQQTVRWSTEYAKWAAANGHNPAVFPGADVIREIGDRYYDLEFAARVAAERLRTYRDVAGDDLLGMLARYNAPALAGGWKSETHRLNYTRGLETARRLLGS